MDHIELIDLRDYGAPRAIPAIVLPASVPLHVALTFPRRARVRVFPRVKDIRRKARAYQE